MARHSLGRTNQLFPPVWLSLALPAAAGERPIAALADAALACGAPIDVGASPALWGQVLRNADEPTLLQRGTHAFEAATDGEHAADLLQAHLLETLSSIGREQVDFYLLPVRRAVEESVIEGALAALEVARQDGHVRFVGLSVEGPPAAALGVLQFHDAFEILVLPARDSAARALLEPVASERRLGIVARREVTEAPAGADACLVTVRSAEEVRLALESAVSGAT